MSWIRIWVHLVFSTYTHLQPTRKYILDQELHHGHTTFAQEVEMFMEKYGWKYIDGIS